ncbi:ParB/Srx family N-terminal domain-containing protein [Gordonia paraffinivorans]|uniref:ParB/Srx family N-terminal domain-containing protein n=1 Tax=Gordonia paraffinivorans TaxID=175628 RepID=UPI00144636CA|nr:ParB/Srx family N-terminal domain-containing protein [Gordonia paraffinivorans]
MQRTITPAAGELRHLDPASLVIDANIRTEAEATLTPEFLESVRDGVRQPILAVEIDGEVRVRDGQRRTLAARQTELSSVPVYVVPVATDADDKAMTIDRILDQLTSFQREELRERDRVAAIEQLALAGMSATRIAKATRSSKKEVDQTLAVAKSATTLNLIERGAELTLEQSAVIAAYDHDPEAQRWLLEAAYRGRFDHQAKQLERSADERAELLAQVAAYKAEGIKAVTRWPAAQNGQARLELLVTESGDPVDIAAVPVDHRIAYVSADVEGESWVDADGNEVDESLIDFEILELIEDGDDSPADVQPAEGYLDPRTLIHRVTRTVETQWWVTDYEELGYKPRPYGVYGVAPGTPASSDEVSEAEKEAQKQERRRVRILNAASVAAREVRIEKLTAWLARKTLPKGSGPKVAKFIATSMHAHHEMFGAMSMQGDAKRIATTILGGDPAELLDQAATADRAQIIGLGIALAAREAHMWKDAWRHAQDRDYDGSYVRARADYLRFLADVLNYTLSDVEEVITGDKNAEDLPLD